MPLDSISPLESRSRLLDGPEKAAVLLLAMGKPAAGRLLKYFQTDDLRAVTRAASRLGSVTPAVVEQLIEELSGALDIVPDITGSDDEAQALLSGAFTPDEVASIMGEADAPAPVSVWQSVATVPDDALLGWIAGEHPQAAAFLLVRLEPEIAARLMAAMPAAGRKSVARRLASIRACRALRRCHPRSSAHGQSAGRHEDERGETDPPGGNHQQDGAGAGRRSPERS